MSAHITYFLLALKGLKAWQFVLIWILALLAVLSFYGYLPILAHLAGVQLPLR